MSKSEMWLTESQYCEGIVRDNRIPEVETVNTSLIDQTAHSVRELETAGLSLRIRRSGVILYLAT